MWPWILIKPSVLTDFLKEKEGQSLVMLEVQVSHLAPTDIQEGALYYCYSGMGVLTSIWPPVTPGWEGLECLSELSS